MVRLDDEYRIEADERQFKLVWKHKPEGRIVKGDRREYTEETVGYFTTLRSLLEMYRKRKQYKMVEEEKLTTGQLIDRIVELDTNICAMFKKKGFAELQYEDDASAMSKGTKKKKNNTEKGEKTNEG